MRHSLNNNLVMIDSNSFVAKTQSMIKNGSVAYAKWNTLDTILLALAVVYVRWICENVKYTDRLNL